MGSFTASEWTTLGLGALLVVLAAIIGYRAWLKSRVSPEERERQRRAYLVAYGKMGDATLVEVREEHLFYSQDVSRLMELIPSDLVVSGPVLIRYDARNPANSIVIAEKWTGLRASKVG